MDESLLTSMMATDTSSATPARPRIQELPKDVVDRIAAGEVVQRPSSVIKELLENSLDADSSKICVAIEKGGLLKMSVSDNGTGIARQDLPLAATRFATSKLRTVDDLNSIQSFGFRGEALASVSLVAKLGIVSRKRNDARAYRMEYRDGAAKGKSTPIAGKEGTTITVQDLFYNVPHRRKMNEREEYQQILSVVQRYALHHASRGVGMVCSRKVKGADTVDLNTTSLPSVQTLMQERQKSTVMEDSDEDHAATRQVIAQVFGSKTEQHLLRLQCEKRSSPNDTDPLEFQYQAHGFITNPSYEPSKGTCELILFVNERLVDSLALKRSIEGVYTEFTKTKPLVYLSVTVPGHQVDVNVHPTKREVALLHQDELYEELCNTIRELLAGSVQTFTAKPLLPESGKKRAANENAPTSSAKRQMDPSRLVRTTKAAPAGALEPFLTPKYLTPPNSDSPEDTSDSSTPGQDVEHQPDCEFFKSSPKIDMSVPGAFANAICRCQVSSNVVVRKRRQVMVRPKRVVPTECSYKSIQSLRSRVAKVSDKKLAKKLRDSTLVGVLSRRQCLVQCGEELLIWNHFVMAQELFYQLALAGFGRGERAVLGKSGVDIKTVMEHALEFEERIDSLSNAEEILQISETNSELAEQATACLMDNAEMLEEYFSICLCQKSEEEDTVMLTALPLLLEGHSPQPHGLPLFFVATRHRS